MHQKEVGEGRESRKPEKEACAEESRQRKNRDGQTIVNKPLHTQWIQLLLKHFHSLKYKKKNGIYTGQNTQLALVFSTTQPANTHQLFSKKGHILDDSKTNSPLGVFREFNNGGEKALR